ncbi:UPF0182 family protein [Telmatobacter bradus]|uniref:UPF0182 family membrane protein n=1 Tax=Telmatobacter bradus TaxID=474953 RepID=UPI003B42C17C
MPATINWPSNESSTTPPRRGIFLIFALLAVLFLGGRWALSFWVDWLWFTSLGQGAVFIKTWSLEWGVFAGFAVATFALLYGVFSLLMRSYATRLPEAHTIFLNGRAVQLPAAKALRVLALIGSMVAAVVSGAAMAAEWQTVALWWSAPAASGAADPIFGRPLGFYLFTLPAWQLILGWLFAMALLSTVLSGLFVLVSGGAQALNGEKTRAEKLSWRGLALSGGVLLSVVAVRVWVSRFSLLFTHHSNFEGMGYTDAHVTVGGLFVVALALAAGALIAFACAAFNRGLRWLLAALAPAVGCYVLVMIAGWYVTTFVVAPNRLQRELPYIAHNIDFTRKAWGLDRFEQREFPAETTVAAADAAGNQPTLENIRLWDWHALQDTLRQLQEIRTYYDFPDIDIDRYTINGTQREVMLAARELNVDKLPDNAHNWINDKLIYTHGYGVTMNTVNGFTPEGLPTLLLSNMPVQSAAPELKLTRPEVYFGEMTSSDVYVKTHQKEFNYPEGETNNLNSYDGKGGIEVGGFMRRLLLAFDRGDLTKLPFSDDVDAQSRLLMRRNVRERVAALAPFLTFEKDPYIVIDGEGRLQWILDGFTTTDSYPYSAHYEMNGERVNSVRNSVKAVIDAYDGTVTFYVFDSEDPILAAWRGIFPSLFKDGAQMPTALRAHIRYPELLLSLQAEAYGLYHMTNPEVFFNGEDKWTVATETSSSQDGEQAAVPMDPNYVMMKLPGEQTQEFVGILPFTPLNRNNMIGWIAGRSDGSNYGKAVVYNFPKTRLVDGPQQIEARIDQNAQLSGQLTLWNQQGSHVRRGSLLVIPCGKALLYAEPIYLQAQRSPMPELRLVVLALQDRLAYAPTFAGALSSLFGQEASSLSQDEEQQQSATTPATVAAATATAKPGEQLSALISTANHDFNDYQHLTAEGKLSEAGQKLDDLKRTLERLNSLPKQ